jgi:hypothetical protein
VRGRSSTRSSPARWSGSCASEIAIPGRGAGRRGSSRCSCAWSWVPPAPRSPGPGRWGIPARRHPPGPRRSRRRRAERRPVRPSPGPSEGSARLGHYRESRGRGRSSRACPARSVAPRRRARSSRRAHPPRAAASRTSSRTGRRRAMARSTPRKGPESRPWARRAVRGRQAPEEAIGVGQPTTPAAVTVPQGMAVDTHEAEVDPEARAAPVERVARAAAPRRVRRAAPQGKAARRMRMRAAPAAKPAAPGGRAPGRP